MAMMKEIDKIWKTVNNSNYIIVLAHRNADGDSIASQIAMGYILKQLKKKYIIIMQDTVPVNFRFMLVDYFKVVIPELIQIPEGIGLSTHLSKRFKRETAIVLDCGDIHRVGHFYPELSSFKNIINIDHHTGNKMFGSYNYVDTSASSCSEVIYDIIHKKFKIDQKLAELLYIGIVSDTKYFCQENASSKCHLIASKLIEKGVNVGRISSYLNSQSIASFKLCGKAVKNTKFVFNNKVAYTILKKKDFSDSGAEIQHTKGLVEFLRDVEGINAALVFREDGKGRIKVSMRGKNGFDVYRIADFFKGGGHKLAAAFSVKGNMEDIVNQVLKKVKSYIK